MNTWGNDKDKDKDKEIEEEIRKEAAKVTPKDKDALSKIRKRTGADKRGNGGKGKGKK
jgi:hypothetical protein